MHSICRTALLLLSVALAGCATATGPEFRQTEIPEMQDSSLLVAYRTSGLVGAAYKLKLYLNGTAVFALPTGGYSYVRIPAGNYTICDSNQKAKFGKRCADFSAKNGMTNYVAFDTGNMGSVPATLKIQPREEALASLLRGYRYEPPVAQAPPLPTP